MLDDDALYQVLRPRRHCRAPQALVESMPSHALELAHRQFECADPLATLAQLDEYLSALFPEQLHELWKRHESVLRIANLAVA